MIKWNWLLGLSQLIYRFGSVINWYFWNISLHTIFCILSEDIAIRFLWLWFVWLRSLQIDSLSININLAFFIFIKLVIEIILIVFNILAWWKTGLYNRISFQIIDLVNNRSCLRLLTLLRCLSSFLFICLGCLILNLVLSLIRLRLLCISERWELIRLNINTQLFRNSTHFDVSNFLFEICEKFVS